MRLGVITMWLRLSGSLRCLIRQQRLVWSPRHFARVQQIYAVDATASLTFSFREHGRSSTNGSCELEMKAASSHPSYTRTAPDAMRDAAVGAAPDAPRAAPDAMGGRGRWRSAGRSAGRGAHTTTRATYQVVPALITSAALKYISARKPLKANTRRQAHFLQTCGAL